MSPTAKRSLGRQPRHWLTPSLGRAPDGDAMQVPVVLLGARHEADVTQAVKAAPLRASMAGAAQLTLSVVDPERELLGPLLDRDEDLLLDDNIDCEVAGIWWRLMGVQPSDDGWDLLLEDRSAAWLRRHTKPLQAARGRLTRGQFVHRLYQEAGGGIPLYVPELHDKQDIARGNRPSTAARASVSSTTVPDTGSGRSWPASQRPRVKGQDANSGQIKAIVGILDECRRLRCSRRVSIAAVMAATQESTMTIGAGTTGNDDTGLFQQGRPWISLANIRDPAKCTRAFLLGGTEAKVGGTGGVPGWKQKHGSLSNAAGSLTEMISDVQQPAARYRGEYAKWEREATRTVDLWLKAGGGGGAAAERESSSTGEAKAYVFERGQDGKRENSLTAINRLASEVGGWRHWVFGNAGVFASDEELVTAPVGLTIDRADQAVASGPSWKWDVRHSASEMRCALFVDRLPEPGQVVHVENEGPASGLWLVTGIDCDLARPIDTERGGRGLQCELTLGRAQATKPEPSPEYAATVSDPDSTSTSRSASGTSGGTLRRSGNKVSGGTVRDRIVFAAKESARLDASGQRLRRAAGGRVLGYSQAGFYSVSEGITGESRPSARSDCSQWVAAMYWSAGAGDPSGQNFNAGYTGTLYANADRVSSPLPGDLCMYGAPPGVHVELYVGAGKTIGHGDERVDYSTPPARSDFFGYYRPRVLKGGGS